MPRMTQASSRAFGLVTPAALQLWLHPLLRALIELVLFAANQLPMPLILRRANATREEPQQLPGERSGPEENQSGLKARIPGGGRGPAALRKRATHTFVRCVSTRFKFETQLLPRSSRRKSGPRGHAHRSSPRQSLHDSWLPTYVGMSDGWEERRLSRAQGARRKNAAS